MKIESLSDARLWCENNLLTRQEAAKITGQSYAAFSQSINLKNLIPFLEFGEGKGIIRLYLKSDVEDYANRLKLRKNNL